LLSTISKAALFLSSIFSFQTIAHADTPSVEPAPVVLVVPTKVPDHVESPIIVSVVPTAAIPKPKPAHVAVTNSQLECLIKVMNHEAGGESARGQKAVGYVVMNRSKSSRFPSTVCGVVYQRSQFTNISRSHSIPTNKYNQLKAIALDIISSYSSINDPTHGSLYFHAASILPNWGNLIRTVRIGAQIFYK
jgi:spore germination cell wall hydrolase CwlJ-like protein